MNLEFCLKLMISEIIEEIDPEMHILLDVIYKRALKTYNHLSKLPDAEDEDDSYIKFSDQVTKIVKQEIAAFRTKNGR